MNSKYLVLTSLVLCLGVLGLFFDPSSRNVTSEFPDLPIAYDLREYSLVTSARQQAWGTCWIFAAFSSLESGLLRSDVWEQAGETGEVNLSEYYLDKFNPFTRRGRASHVQEGWYSGQGENFPAGNLDDPDTGVVVHLGGDFRMIAASFNHGLGAVQERLTPDIPPNGNHQLFGDLPNEGILREHPEYKFFYPYHIEWLSLYGSEREKRKRIKQSIVDYGAVASAQIVRDMPLGFAPDGLEIHGVFPGGQKLVNPDDFDPNEIDLEPANHAISLIGWDDTIEWNGYRGAWLVKDSDRRDESTGEFVEYFYVLYNDLVTAKDELMGGVRFRDVKNEDITVYNHARHGWRYSTEGDEKVREVKTRFEMKERGRLHSLGVYTLAEGVQAFARVYLQKADADAVEQLENVTIEYVYPGLHRLRLEGDHLYSEGDIVTVHYRNSHGGHAYDASFDLEVLLGDQLPEWGRPISVHSAAQEGETFYRSTEKGQWKDFSRYLHPFNEQAEHAHAKEFHTASVALSLFVVKE